MMMTIIMVIVIITMMMTIHLFNRHSTSQYIFALSTLDKYNFGDRPELLFKIVPVASHIDPRRDTKATSIVDEKTCDYRAAVIPYQP